MSRRFQKRKEDFSCEHCGFFVVGNGFTDHCPNCLWGKHVDVFPGDRSEVCRGLLEPIILELSRDGYVIAYRCARCGAERRNKSASNDDIALFLNQRGE